MLLELEIENERTFASASVLSLIASKRKEASTGAVRSVGDAANTKALTSALILGKNGSGKSTLIRALSFIRQLVRNSAKESQAGELLPYEPNILSEGFSNQPTRYRVLFSYFDIIYDFSFSYDKNRILSESMDIADRSSRFRRLYDRTWDEKSESYNYLFGDALAGTRRVWEEATRDNALYLSTAVQLNSDVLKKPFLWLSRYFRIYDHEVGEGVYTTSRSKEDESFKGNIVRFLQAMDINVHDIEFEEEDMDMSFMKMAFSAEFLADIRKRMGAIEEKVTKVFFVKKTTDGRKIRLPLTGESTGTQALYKLAGPLYDTLENGYCLIIDEINTNLHPLIVKFLFDLFSSEKLNRNRAQLLFTSHDVSILREGVVRRDQVWFIDNDGCEASLAPLSDYSPRRGEALEKGYLSGRYGGVPALLPSLLRFS